MRGHENVILIGALSYRIEPPRKDGDDLVRQCYGSEDFRTGVRSFVEKKEPQWIGR